MARVQIENNFETTLAATITSLDTDLILSSVTGIPTLDVTGDFFYLTLIDIDGNIEITKVTSYSLGTNTVTVERGQDGTTALDFDMDSKVSNRPTKATMELLLESWFTRDGLATTRVDSTSFTLAGDQTSTYKKDRVVKAYSDAGVETLHYITDATYSTLTTVTVDGVLPDPLALVELGPDVDWLPQQANAATADNATSADKIIISSNDTTAGYLEDKLVAGANIALTTVDDGADETRSIAVTGALLTSNNLSEVVDSTARTNLGLGGAAVEDVETGGTGDLLRSDGTGEDLTAVVAVGTKLNSTPAHTVFSGEFVTMTAGESLNIPNLCYLKSDGKLYRADADSSATMPGIFLATETLSANASGQFLRSGYITNTFWSWTVGGLIYASGTVGDFTQTAPSGSGDIVQVVGIAKSATTFDFRPSLNTLEVD